MNKKSIDLVRARVTLTRLLALLCFVGYFASKIKLVYMEMALILVFLGLVMLLIMESFKDVAEDRING